ncbi:MAG TPA: NAD(P)-dependent alcohol dehydrogenase [Solirubrobacteraceae bacterium]|nr:NAD(P)-dependent alcohol dehydrogenase [Solirubrobacteraceae bacterium]
MSATSVTAAVVRSEGAPFALEQLELSEPRPGEVRVRMAMSGICHTDILIQEGDFPAVPMPVVLGHEGAGVVEEIGSAVTSVKVGDRVALSYASCGDCTKCMTGQPFHCAGFFPHNFLSAREDGSTALASDGQPVHSHFFGQSSFATGAIVPERSVVPIPDDVPFEVVAPFGCGVQTGAGSVINAVRPQAGSSMAVFGAGGVGLSAIMAAAICGCAPIIAVDLRPARLELALELGATHAINCGEVDPVEAILELTGGVDTSLEASGVPGVLRQAFDVLAPDSLCGLIGAPPLGTEESFDVNAMLSTGRIVRGLVEGHSVPQVFIPQLIELWRAGRLPMERLVRAYDFDQINEAAADAVAGRVVKPVLRISG